MDDTEEYKIRIEAETKAKILWGEFLNRIYGLGFEAHFASQELEFKNPNYKRSDMRSRFLLRMPDKNDNRF